MTWPIRTILCVVALLASLTSQIHAQDSAKGDDSAGIAFFEAKVRPVLVQHCYKCHSRAENKSEGGLLLDSRDGIRKGGDRGPSVVPGKPDESILLSAISHRDSDLQMPPKKD